MNGRINDDILLHLVGKRIFNTVAADISLIRKHYHYVLRLWHAPWSFSELMQDVDFGVLTLQFFCFSLPSFDL